MISVDVFAGSPSAEAKSEDFIFFDFLSFLESLSLPIVSCKVVGPRIVRRFYLCPSGFEVFAIDGADIYTDARICFLPTHVFIYKLVNQVRYDLLLPPGPNANKYYICRTI
jgi:hypothetical protein